MARKPISDNAAVLLAIVADNTIRDWSTGKLDRYFYPQSSMYFYRDNGRACSRYITGAADAHALRGLATRGLIERPPGCDLSNPYVYALTEEGLLYLETSGLRERFDDSVIHPDELATDDD